MRERIPGLDLLRALAITMVVVGHARPLLTLTRPLSSFWWLEGGRMGVDLFFVLSGFLIGGILLETHKHLGTSRILAGFLIGRWLRTLPLYYFFLLVNVLVHLAFFPWPFGWGWELSPYLWFGQNLTERTPPFFFESWSLAVEEWFYLLMPLALWAGLRAGMSFSRCLGACLGTMLAVPLLLRVEAGGGARLAPRHLQCRRLPARRDRLGHCRSVDATDTIRILDSVERRGWSRWIGNLRGLRPSRDGNRAP